MPLLGAHMSTAGGVDKAIERGQSIGCTVIQIFVKNNNQWFSKPLQDEEAERFLRLKEETGIFIFAHAGYLINLASPDPENHKKSMDSMLDELERCTILQLPFIVLHPGSYLDQTKEQGIKNVAANLTTLLAQSSHSNVKILIETTAGQGTNLGQTFEEIRYILELVNVHQRIGVCFDTCHSFSAGYDIKSKNGFKKTWEDFDKIIGIDQLHAIHLNDSKGELGSHKDRHEHIGEGYLGKETFKLLLNDKRFSNLPMVLETPKDKEMKFDKTNLAILHKLIYPASEAVS